MLEVGRSADINCKCGSPHLHYVLSENLRRRRSSQQSGSYQNERILPRKEGAKFIEKVCSDLNVKLKSALTAICKDGPKVIVKMSKILGIIYTHCMAQSLH